MKCPMCGTKECCGAEMDITMNDLSSALNGLLEIAGYTYMSDIELREEMLAGNKSIKPILVARAVLRETK